MRVYKCDRCGKVYNDSEDVPLLKTLKTNNFTRSTFDYCPICQIDLQVKIKEFYKMDEQDKNDVQSRR